jgi:peptide deformylase
MSLKPIATHPDPVLRNENEVVTDFGEDLKSLIVDMAETMYSAPGVGLAAPQISVNKRVFVIDVGENDPIGSPVLRVFVNPEILEKQGEILWEEGCLSVPDMNETVKRAERVAIRALDENGEVFEMEVEGLLAVAMQHENDHLNGVLFFDHLSPLKRKLALKKYMKEQKEKTKAG